MRHLPLALLLAGFGVCSAGAQEPAGDPEPETITAPSPPSGDFTVITMRRASDVAGGPIEQDAAQRIGQTVSFGETLTWWDGRTCESWAAEPMDQQVLPLDDPLLSDTQVPPLDGPISAGDRRQNTGWSLTCEGEALGVLLQVDDRVLIAPTRSGVTNIILERPLTPDEILAFQKQLKDMKFFTGEPSATWDEASLAGLASYAEYRGAKYRFARTAITENLLDGLRILAGQMPSDDPYSWEELKVVINGDVSAHFRGERMELVPLEYGVKELHFTFAGDDEPYVFVPEGTLYATDWTFDIYAPDGEHVLLLQDRFGPYHLVALKDLKAYLKGEAEPAHVIGKPAKEGAPAAVHSDANWLSPFELEYTVTCCGTKEKRKFNTRFPDYQPKNSPDTLTDYRPSLSADVAALPAAEPGNLKKLLKAHEKWRKRAKKSPGKWEEGNIPLGGDPKEYVPSDAELMAGELCERIGSVVFGTEASALSEAVRNQKIKPQILECKQISFRHVDVMGSGRFFYASEPREVAIRIKAGE
jgi:hypothetical protein